MNTFQKLVFLTKSLFSDDFTDPNKLYEAFSTAYGLTNFNFSKRSFENFIKEGFTESPEVYSVVSKISQTFSTVPWVVKEKTRDGVVINETSELNAVLDCPNQLQTWAELQESAAIMYQLTGNMYMNGTEAVGFEGFRELTVLPSQATAPVRGDAINPIKGYQLEGNRTVQNFTAEEVLHMKAFDPRIEGFETLIGLSPLEAAMFAYSASNQKWEAMSSIMKNKGVMGIVTTKQGTSMRKEDSIALQDEYKRRYGGASQFGTPMFTNADLGFIPMGMSASDLKLIEQGVISLRAICNVYKVNSALFNDPANKTFNNQKEAKKEMWQDAIIPLLDKFKQAYNNWLVPAYAKAENKELYLDYDITKIDVLQEDLEKKAKIVVELVREGVITPNEGREMIQGFDRKEGVEFLDQHKTGGSTEASNLE